MQAPTSRAFFEAHKDDIKTILQSSREVEEACIDFSDAQQPWLYLKSQTNKTKWVEHIERKLRQLYKNNNEPFTLATLPVNAIPSSAASILFYISQARQCAVSAAADIPLLTAQPERLSFKLKPLTTGLQNVNITQIGEYFSARFRQAGGEFQKILDEMTEINAIADNDTKLPSKTILSEEENKKYDVERLNFINKILLFLTKWWGLELKISLKLTRKQEIEANIWKIFHSERALQHIALAIFNFSGELRGNYKQLLKPHPFTWETFEQLVSAIIVDASVDRKVVTQQNIGDKVLERLTDEHRMLEFFAAAALPSIIYDDIPQLIELFKYIQSQLQGAIKADILPLSINLFAIKALTRRVMDIKTLIDLLKYADSTSTCSILEDKKIFKKLEKNIAIDHSICTFSSSSQFKRPFDLENLIGKHAALRRLEKIGELVTGKNISSFLQKLDPTIDWKAFITIRDTIAHQERSENRIRINKFLANNQQFLLIARDQMQEFYIRLNQIVILRDKHSLQFKKDNIEIFWQEVYENEKKAQVVDSEDEQNQQAQPRVLIEELDLFMQTLRELNAPEDIQRQWLELLNGEGNMPAPRKRGELFSIFSSLRTSNKKLFERCKNIFGKAIKHNPNSSSREEQQRKKIDKEQNFRGLESVRALAKEWTSTPMISTCTAPTILTSQEKIDYVNEAIKASENIMRFMGEDKVVETALNSLKVKGSGTMPEEVVSRVADRLYSSRKFNDAIEYNAAQLLHYLDIIYEEYPESKEYPFFEKNYQGIKALRNILVHDNPLFTIRERFSGEERKLLTFIQEQLITFILPIILELLPILREIETKLTPVPSAAAAAAAYV